jgi:hypothetical protein
VSDIIQVFRLLVYRSITESENSIEEFINASIYLSEWGGGGEEQATELEFQSCLFQDVIIIPPPSLLHHIINFTNL